jgi:hypothetical protein
MATVLLLSWATPTPAEEISGSYVLKGNVGAGAYYDGALTIRPGGAAFDLDWQFADAEPATGYALRLDDVIGGVFAEDGDGVGIVLYRVRGGELDGVWNGFGNFSGSIGRETLSGGSGLQGTYQVTLGLNPDNSRYTGVVTIRRSGQVYLVDWAVPRIVYTGTGVLVGDVFVVAYAAKHRPKVWAYCVGERVWTGVVSIADADRITAEIMWPAGQPAPADAEARLANLQEDAHIRGCGEVPVASLTQIWR